MSDIPLPTNLNRLPFHIDVEELEALKDIHGATEMQMRAAYNRALGRTVITLRSLTNKKLRDEMGIKSLKAIRKRFQHFRLRSPSKQKKFDELKLWYGMNDVSVGYLKGSIRRNGSKKSPNGAIFKPRGKIPTQTYDNGFVTRLYNRRSIFTRKTANRYPVVEARVPVADELNAMIEDDIYERLPEIFLKHFETDLKGRVKMGLHKKNWKKYG